MSTDLFRMRPVVVEARRLEPPYAAVADWCGGDLIKQSSGRRIIGLSIPTADGFIWVDLGDWVIRHNGEFSCCKPDIFEATYESVEPTDV